MRGTRGVVPELSTVLSSVFGELEKTRPHSKTINNIADIQPV